MAYSKEEFQKYYDYIKEITNGVFSVSAPHHDLIQVKDCEWSVVYDLLRMLGYESAEIGIKVKYEDFSEIEAPSIYEDIDKAIERGHIRMKASLRTDGTIDLTRFISHVQTSLFTSILVVLRKFFLNMRREGTYGINKGSGDVIVNFGYFLGYCAHNTTIIVYFCNRKGKRSLYYSKV